MKRRAGKRKSPKRLSKTETEIRMLRLQIILDRLEAENAKMRSEALK